MDDGELDLITELMNGLADAMETLNFCFSSLTEGNELRQRIADTVTQIEAVRLKVLKRLVPELL
jgi:hypothetical protein